MSARYSLYVNRATKETHENSHSARNSGGSSRYQDVQEQDPDDYDSDEHIWKRWRESRKHHREF